jgi:hypothetical protein
VGQAGRHPVIDKREALRLFGREVWDPMGRRVGIIGEFFLDDRTEQPTWVTVEAGLFGTNQRFVPLDGAAFDGDTLTVAVPKAVIRRAPRVSVLGDLPWEAERELYVHYGRWHGLLPEDYYDVSGGSSECHDYVEAVRSRLRHWAHVVALPPRAPYRCAFRFREPGSTGRGLFN